MEAFQLTDEDVKWVLKHADVTGDGKIQLAEFPLVKYAWEALLESKGREAEEVSDAQGVAVAATLLGAIGFQMVVFYLTNHRDADMRKYTYGVISQTIGIFSAVLVFASLHDILQDWVFKDVSESTHTVVSFVHHFFWNFVLQIALAYLSGALMNDDIKVQTDPESLDVDLKCFALLLAHLTGFASIMAWANLQQLEPFKQSPAFAALVVPFAIIYLFILQFICGKIRQRLSSRDGREADKFEELYDEEASESEIDIMGLTVFFLLVQILRFAIGGALPSSLGTEEMGDLCSHTPLQMAGLISTGIFFNVVVFLIVMFKPKSLGEIANRFTNTALAVLGMSFAWCVFFGAKWFVASFPQIHAHPKSAQMLIGLILAIFMSGISFGLIRVLDRIADSDCTGDEVDKGVRQVISAFGILVGFAWERCFDKAIEHLASVFSETARHLVVFLLAMSCAIIVVPAWRLYILPMVLKEGWRYGFVVDKNDDKWADFAQDPRFNEAKIRRAGGYAKATSAEA
eukprot:gnl/TRDRNA2_/TRDRNA2_175058_c1_seq1.p1 gnl/TRDRNA2_/TRDRNA2_175058_c1~~gnl/TRDRNA2_/TRDRNA2_175058_c1_seq1.p1  ORF type:complete len:515 (+),score=77.50 gnl/TRDRNA2_/TRDRNA2_175058_c1_seq1:110-1654(+)